MCVTWLVDVESCRLATRVRSQASASASRSICSCTVVGKSIDGDLYPPAPRPGDVHDAALAAAAVICALRSFHPCCSACSCWRSLVHRRGCIAVSSLFSAGNSFWRMKVFLSGPVPVTLGGKNVLRASTGSSCGSTNAPAAL